MIRFASCLAALLLLPHVSQSAVSVIIGPTPIVDGEARSSGDITVVNDRLAFALAVQSPVPYGVPRGALIDAAAVENGLIGRDRVVFADFIPNNWSAWPNSHQRVEILERGPRRALIRAERDWGKATVETLYTLDDHSDHVVIQVTLRNTGDVALADLLSGLTLWPKGGFFFGLPGLAAERGAAEATLADRVVAYDEGWMVALHAPYIDHFAHGGEDLYRLHTLQSGQSRTFEGWLQIGPRGDVAPVVRAEILRKHLDSGSVSGLVNTRDGKRIDQPVVVVEKQGKLYAWTFGQGGAYALDLPVGDYSLYATATDHSRSEPVPVKVTAGAHESHDFGHLDGPGEIRFAVVDSRRHEPLDARVAIAAGPLPAVGFLGRKTFFTELDPPGRLDVAIAPGHYVFDVSAGGGFLSRSRQVRLDVSAGKVQSADVALTPQFDPPARGWFSADLHHHADQAEAVTPPEFLARSQFAAGLNVLFVGDHDSAVNHAALQRIAAKRGRVVIPGMELSPSWGHFNAYPLRPGEPLAIDTSTASIDMVFAEARRLGALVIQVNHPYIAYGYFSSLAAGVAPGGFNPKFDLLEINAQAPGDDQRVLQRLWEFWNGGHHYSLAAGTDTHDVWNDVSGRVRTFAHIEGELTAVSFARALQGGHGYVSSGPLLFPEVMFGADVKTKPAEPVTLAFDLQSVAGLKQAQLIRGGLPLFSRTFAGGPQEAHVEFATAASQPTWCQLIVEDREGHKAYSDPIWIDPVELDSVRPASTRQRAAPN